MSEPRANGLGIVGAVWGVGGICWLIGSAVARLTPIALEAVREGMDGLGWTLFVACICFMAYSEGYKGFQLNFSPRVVARAQHLARYPTVLHVLLAPAFCMALFHARRKRLIVSWTILIGVIGLIVLVRGLAQPWRGIVDAGVVVGLSWGLVAIAAFAVRALNRGTSDADPDLPES